MSWSPPTDLRERMLRATVRGTNLDTGPGSNPTGTPNRSAESIETRRDKARIAARERRARVKREKESQA